MKFKYLICSCCEDLPVGTNSKEVVDSYLPNEDYYVVDLETIQVLFEFGVTELEELLPTKEENEICKAN